eukprot:gene18581-22182_t
MVGRVTAEAEAEAEAAAVQEAKASSLFSKQTHELRIELEATSTIFRSSAASRKPRIACPLALASSQPPALLWLRPHALRTLDNPALQAAASGGRRPVVAVWLDGADEDLLDEESAVAIGWLERSLAQLAQTFAHNWGAPILRRRGSAGDVLPEVAARCGAKEVVWPGCPSTRDRERALERRLRACGLSSSSVPASCVLHEPWEYGAKSIYLT